MSLGKRFEDLARVRPRLVEQASEPCVSAVAAAWQHLGPLTALGRSAGLHAGRRLGDGMCEHTRAAGVANRTGL